jgi:hypothetical protein
MTRFFNGIAAVAFAPAAKVTVSVVGKMTSDYFHRPEVAMRRRVAALLVVVSLATGASAEGILGRSRSTDREPAFKAVRSVSIVVGFGVEERLYILDWFHDSNNLKALPPSFAKRELPAGTQQLLEKDGKLPPGLESKLQPLPVVLEGTLPKLPDGNRRILVGDNVILLDEATSSIVDIIAGVF